MKKVVGIHGNPRQHWVGNGFPVRSLLSYQTLRKQASPFLLLDYAGPAESPPAAAPGEKRGVGAQLTGEPIAEPIVGHGPFVMNTRDEIATAISDFNAGRFGRIGDATQA